MKRGWLYSAQIKYIIGGITIVIASLTLIVGYYLKKNIVQQEHAYMQIWSESMKTLINADEETDLSLVLSVINSNDFIPVIVTDDANHVLAARNLGISQTLVNQTINQRQHLAFNMLDEQEKYTLNQIYRQEQEFRTKGRFMKMMLEEPQSETQKPKYIHIYYANSKTLHLLSYYPYILWGAILVLLTLAIYALWSNARAKNNQLWVSLSKETAHQLGTPISSLLATSEYLHMLHPDELLLKEMDKDVERLQLIAARFSKIGSMPKLKQQNIVEIVNNAIEYMESRISKRVTIIHHPPSQPISYHVSAELYEWVVENICKNAVDAMEGSGKIVVRWKSTATQFSIYITDTGKGIPKNKWSKIFTPGYTTKERGWGLGLSLAKRIVEEIHHGKLFILDSKENQGTTFCIQGDILYDIAD